MMIFIIGGSGSGKSEYAEDCMASLPGQIKKYYIATMRASDAESREKIKRHRRLRKGKEFRTIEQPVDIQEAAGKMEGGEKAALLECMSNLAANEMFSGSEPEKGEDTAEKIIRGIEALLAEVDHLVIMSCNIFEDGMEYDRTTMEYIRAMGRINQRLAAMSDRAVEVVAGIPLEFRICRKITDTDCAEYFCGS